jgi:hypothetical protein
MIFSRTTKPEKLIFTQKLSDMVQIQICTNHGPRGSGGGHNGETRFYTCLYWKKNISKYFPELAGRFQSNFIQVCTNKGPDPL